MNAMTKTHATNPLETFAKLCPLSTAQGGGNTPIVLIKYEEDDMLCREEIL